MLACLLALKLTRYFDNLRLHIDHTVGPKHLARQRCTLEVGLNGFKLPIGIDEAEVQTGTI